MTPTEVAASANRDFGFVVTIGNERHWADEVLQDDGTYGHLSDGLIQIGISVSQLPVDFMSVEQSAGLGHQIVSNALG